MINDFNVDVDIPNSLQAFKLFIYYKLLSTQELVASCATLSAVLGGQQEASEDYYYYYYYNYYYYYYYCCCYYYYYYYNYLLLLLLLLLHILLILLLIIRIQLYIIHTARRTASPWPAACSWRPASKQAARFILCYICQIMLHVELIVLRHVNHAFITCHIMLHVMLLPGSLAGADGAAVLAALAALAANVDDLEISRARLAELISQLQPHDRERAHARLVRSNQTRLLVRGVAREQLLQLFGAPDAGIMIILMILLLLLIILMIMII